MRILSIIAFGGLVGFFVGMSSGPVVGGVLVAIVGAVLASPSLGFSASKNPLSDEARRAWPRILLTFCLSCFLASIGGLSLRTNDLLGATTIPEIEAWQAWKEAGLTDEYALLAVLGAHPQPGANSGHFFSAPQSGKLDTNERPLEHNDSDHVLDRWEKKGGRWKDIAVQIRQCPKDRRIRMCIAAWDLAFEVSQ